MNNLQLAIEDLKQLENQRDRIEEQIDETMSAFPVLSKDEQGNGHEVGVVIFDPREKGTFTHIGDEYCIEYNDTFSSKKVKIPITALESLILILQNLTDEE